MSVAVNVPYDVESHVPSVQSQVWNAVLRPTFKQLSRILPGSEDDPGAHEGATGGLPPGDTHRGTLGSPARVAREPVGPVSMARND